MRRGMLLGLGLAGAVAVHAGATAQFAADRTNPPPQPAPTPPAVPAPAPQPLAFPTQPAASPPAFTPAAPAAQQAPRPEAHPWYVRPDLGPWMICVKSYTGPESLKLAEALATDVRQRYKAGAYLFEWGAEERRKEEERQEQVRKEKEKEYAPFLAVREKMKAQAAAEGREFFDTPVKYRVGKVNYPEQWAVLVGGFKDQDAARKALDVVRQWKPPADPKLMDYAVISGSEQENEARYINPFATAMTVPNPAVRHSAPGQVPPADPALAKLNEAEELSLLKARKPWTLLVKRFVVPTQVQTKNGDVSVIDKLFGTDNAAKWLDATAKQGHELAKALRDPRMKPHPFEAFVLHARTESVVTVGQFDGPDDPALIETWKVLTGMTFQINYKDGRPPETRPMFDAVTPMRVPRP